MNLYRDMDADTLEAKYNLGALRPDLPEVMARWQERTAALADNDSSQLDIEYGNGERDRLDLYSAGKGSPLLIYIHGGYWQRGDKNLYGWISEAFVSNGVSVAVPNYNLTPSVRVGEIAPQLRRAVNMLWQQGEALGFDRSNMTVMGHSAGGHLTAMMMSTHWPEVDADMPTELFRAAVPISGIFELEPLVHTSINAGPQMDVAEARKESPCNIPPVTNATQLVAVGGTETTELIRQSDDHAARYATAQRQMPRYTVPNADHFDALEPLAQEDSEFFSQVMALIR
jgi:arylformamidase